MTEVEQDMRLAELLERALAEARTTGSVDPGRWRTHYPTEAEEVLRMMEMTQILESAAASCRDQETFCDEVVPLPATVDGSEATPEPLPPATTPARPEVPAQLGRYRILGRIGSGGMGDVYKAQDTQLQRVVAIKIPRFSGPDQAQAQARQRFLREARAAAAVRHPHVCPVYDVGEQDGVLFVVMSYVEGQSLGERLQSRGRYADCRAAAQLVRQVAEALAAVHAAGLIHRDIKPGNILLDRLDHALLTDFGLARPEKDAEHLTADGALVGTPAYMPPEMASLTRGTTTAASDIYSLGVVLYQMVTGRTPYEGSALAVISSIALETPTPTPDHFRADLDSGLQAIILKAMARRPEERYASAQAFADALGAWCVASERTALLPGPTAPVAAAVPVAVPAATAPTTRVVPAARPAPAARSWWSRRKVVAAVVAAALVGVAALAAAFGPIQFRTADGTLVLDVMEPGAEVTIDGESKAVFVESPKLGRIVLRPGKHTVTVKWQGQEVTNDVVTLESGKEKVLAVRWKPVGVPPIPIKGTPSPLDVLQAKDIPEKERFAGQPKELVAVFGSHAWRHWGSGYAQMDPVLAFTPDGKDLRVLTCFPNLVHVHDGPFTTPHRVTVSDGATGKPLRVITKPGVSCVCLSKDGKLVGVVSGDPTFWRCECWEVDTGKRVFSCPGGGSQWVPSEVTISADGKWVAVLGHPGQVTVYDLERNAQKITFPYKHDTTLGDFYLGGELTLSPDGRFVAWVGRVGPAGESSFVQVFDLTKGSVALDAEVAKTQFHACSFAAGGKKLALVSSQLNRWYLHSWDLEKKDHEIVEGAGIATANIAFSPDGGRFAANGPPNPSIWDAATGKVVVGLKGPVGYRHTWSVDGRKVAGSTTDGRLLVWDAATGELQTPTAEEGGFRAVSLDGRYLAVIGSAARLDILDVTTGKPTATLRLPEGQTFGTVAFSPNAREVITQVQAGPHNPLRVWDANTGEQVTDLDVPMNGLGFDLSYPFGGGLAFSPDGRFLAGGGFGGVWSTGDWKVRAVLKSAQGENVHHPQFSPDGKTVAFLCGSSVKVFDPATGKEQASFPAMNGTGYPRFFWLAEGKHLYVEGKLYDVQTGKEVPGFRKDLPALGLSLGETAAADGKSFFTRDADTVTQWSAATGEKLREWQFPGWVRRLAVTPEGRYLITSNQNGTIYVLRLAPVPEPGDATRPRDLIAPGKPEK